MFFKIEIDDDEPNFTELGNYLSSFQLKVIKKNKPSPLKPKKMMTQLKLKIQFVTHLVSIIKQIKRFLKKKRKRQ